MKRSEMVDKLHFRLLDFNGKRVTLGLQKEVIEALLAEAEKHGMCPPLAKFTTTLRQCGVHEGSSSIGDQDLDEPFTIFDHAWEEE